MKKGILTFLAVTVFLTTTACAASNSNSGSSGNSSNESSLQTSNNSSTIKSSNESSTESISTSSSSVASEPKNKIIQLEKQGEKHTVADGKYEIEISFNGVDKSSEVRSKSTNMFSQYFVDQSDETYLYLSLDIKNIGGDSVSYRVFDDIKIIYDDKYKYYAQQLDTESPVMSQYWSISPLKSQEVWFVASIPDEIINKSFVFSFKMGKTTFEFHGEAVDN